MARLCPLPYAAVMGSDESESLQLDLLAASLRADLDDLDAFVEGLAVKLEAALPGLVHVERTRHGLRGPRRVSCITLDSGAGERLELRRDQRRVETLRARVSGGITLRTEPLAIEPWLGALTQLLAREAASSERTRRALERMLLAE